MSGNFVCQQCKQPLQPDSSVVDLSPSAYDMLTASLPQHPRTSRALKTPAPIEVKSALEGAKLSSSPKSRSKVTTANTTPSPSPAPSANPNPTPLSHHLRSTFRLFALLSSRTEIDHPLCAECTHILLSSLNKQLEETKKERDGYIAFEKEAKREREKNAGVDKDAMQKRIQELVEHEKLSIEELKLAEFELAKLDEELQDLDDEERRLEEEEAEFWRTHNANLLTLSQQTGQLRSIRAAYAADAVTLERLERTNVYNDAFCIGQDGALGTINGLRLGRTSSVQVEWTEINAAWGQTLLLLYTLARKVNFIFEMYQLVPLGSLSRIERISGDKASYELYGSGDIHLGRILHNRRFDFAMVAFLDCLRQLMEFAKNSVPPVEFPHQIIKDKIGEASIKLQFSQEESWTRALRHVLVALRILLKWAT